MSFWLPTATFPKLATTRTINYRFCPVFRVLYDAFASYANQNMLLQGGSLLYFETHYTISSNCLPLNTVIAVGIIKIIEDDFGACWRGSNFKHLVVRIISMLELRLVCFPLLRPYMNILVLFVWTFISRVETNSLLFYLSLRVLSYAAFYILTYFPTFWPGYLSLTFISFLIWF